MVKIIVILNEIIASSSMIYSLYSLDRSFVYIFNEKLSLEVTGNLHLVIVPRVCFGHLIDSKLLLFQHRFGYGI